MRSEPWDIPCCSYVHLFDDVVEKPMPGGVLADPEKKGEQMQAPRNAERETCLHIEFKEEDETI